MLQRVSLRPAMPRRCLALAMLLVSLAAVSLAADPPRQPDTPSLESVVAANKALEEEIARLKGLQDADPCAIHQALGLPATVSDKTPAAPEKIDLAKIEAATVLIFALHDKAKMGTGFFVAPGIVVTNFHVVKNNAQVILVSKGLTHPLRGRVMAETDADGRDYALVKVEASQTLADPLPLCGTVRKTDKVGTWGFPGVISQDDPKFQRLLEGDLSSVPEAVYSEGVVNVVHDSVTPNEILHTAVLSPGNSGGPLVNASGCVVGINTAIQADEESYRQTNVSLGAADLAAYMRSQGIAPTFYP